MIDANGMRMHRRGIRHIVQAAETQATGAAVQPTEWLQKVVELPPLSRGCHVITRQLLQQLPELAEFEVGMANFFVQHTSCSLTINENASPDVPLDLADSLDRLAPEGNQVRYRHDDEGPDDMPAHVKSSLMGASLQVPVQHGRLALGTWQGIYLNEHRWGGWVMGGGGGRSGQWLSSSAWLVCVWKKGRGRGAVTGAAMLWIWGAGGTRARACSQATISCTTRPCQPGSCLAASQHRPAHVLRRNYGGPRRLVITVQGQKRADGRKYGTYR
jgi:secondary thiamine-phosphate synthase enzyme